MICPNCKNEVNKLFFGTYGHLCRTCRNLQDAVESSPLKTLQQEWEDYKTKIYPDGISGVQNRETYQAFFSGAFVAFLQHQKVAELPEGDAIRELAKLQKEVQEVLQSIAGAMKARN